MNVRFRSWDHLMKLRRAVGELNAHDVVNMDRTALNYRSTKIVILQSPLPK